MSSLAMVGILGDGTHGTDHGDGIVGAGITDGTIGDGIQMWDGDGTHGIVLGDGTMDGTIGDGTHGMDVLIWDGVIISTTVMYIMATTGIITIGIMAGIMVKIIETPFTVVAKVAH